MALRLTLLQRVITLSLVLLLHHTATAAIGGRKGNAEKCEYK
ncbi:interleukin-17 receptor D, partial [Tachysurus ichikawai]